MANIVVIDDIKEIRELLQSYLELKNHTVFIASNGSIAIDIIKKENIDIVITDMVMPDYSGMETILELKKSYPHIHIIAMSGDGSNSILQLSLAENLGVKKTFSKPLDLANLSSYIDLNILDS